MAYDLNNLRLNAEFISHVGNDPYAEELLKVLGDLNLNIEYCQIDEQHKISRVDWK